MAPSLSAVLTTLSLATFDCLPSYPGALPNGNFVPCWNNAEGCTDGFCIGLGHNTCGGGTLPLNAFGLDFKSVGYAWTPDLCEMDSDGDGRSNGEELGDPCCVWTQGVEPMQSSKNGFVPSHPGAADSSQSNDYERPSCVDQIAPSVGLVARFNDGEEQRTWEAVIDSYEVPKLETVYVNFRFNFDDESQGIFHIVYGVAMVDQPRHLHHFVITGCKEKVPPEQIGKPVPENTCTENIGGFSGWAPGGIIGDMPPTTGIPFGKDAGVVGINLQVHFTDVDKADGPVISRDGVRIFYTPDLRPTRLYSLMSLLMVDEGYPTTLPPAAERFFVTRSCTVIDVSVDIGCWDSHADIINMARSVGLTITGCHDLANFCNHPDPNFRTMMLETCTKTCSGCGSAPAEDAQSDNPAQQTPLGERPYVSTYFHAHLLGREMYSQRLRDGEIQDLSSQENWNFNYQASFPVNSSIRSGDVITSTCVFRTTSRDNYTKFGLSTYEEMCNVIGAVLYDTEATNPHPFYCVGGQIWTGHLESGEDARNMLQNHPWFDGVEIYNSKPEGAPTQDQEGLCSRYMELVKFLDCPLEKWSQLGCDRLLTHESACGGTHLPQVVEDCGGGCKVKVQGIEGMTCRDYCATQGLECIGGLRPEQDTTCTNHSTQEIDCGTSVEGAHFICECSGWSSKPMSWLLKKTEVSACKVEINQYVECMQSKGCVETSKWSQEAEGIAMIRGKIEQMSEITPTCVDVPGWKARKWHAVEC